MAVQLTRRRFNVDELIRMVEVGILQEDDRVELIDGEIIEMSPIGSRHAAGVNRFTHLFVDRIGHAAQVRVQSPILLDRHNQPQPDVALVHPRDDFYESGHPSPKDVFLIVEVSDTTLGFDQQVKLPIYARRGIPEVWIVDLSLRGIRVYRDPSPPGYGVSLLLLVGDTLTPLAFPNHEFSVSEIVGEG